MIDIEIDILRHSFEKSWSRETSYPGSKNDWSPHNPAIGQCAVTSLIVNDLCGGKIVYNRDYHHYWNILEDGTEIDLTKGQFGDQVNIKGYCVARRKYILDSEPAALAKTAERYALLKSRVEKLLLVEQEK